MRTFVLVVGLIQCVYIGSCGTQTLSTTNVMYVQFNSVGPLIGYLERLAFKLPGVMGMGSG